MECLEQSSAYNTNATLLSTNPLFQGFSRSQNVSQNHNVTEKVFYTPGLMSWGFFVIIVVEYTYLKLFRNKKNHRMERKRKQMDFNAVYHQASDNYCYPLNEDELIINIKTGYDVQSVSIILGDPFAAGILGGGEHWDGTEEAIIYKKRLKNQIWWTTTVRPEYKRLKYYFKLQTENESWFYFEDGFVSDEQMHLEGRSRQCFVFPWMNPCDVPRTPAG